MGKESKKQTIIVKDPQDHPISKSKTLLVNLNSYIRMLKNNFPDMSSKQYIKNVHRFIDKIKRKLKYTDQQKLVEARQKIKICKKCECWSSNRTIIQCNLCEDYYHDSCVKKSPSGESRDLWCCETCDNDQKKKKNDKNDHLKSNSKADQCEKCDRGRLQFQAFVTCMKCNMKYHKSCYGKPNAVCYKCHHQIERQIKQKTKFKSLLDFHFTKTESSKKRNQSPSKNPHNDQFKIFGKNLKYNDIEEQTTQASSLATINSFPMFRKNYPSMTEQQIEQYKRDLYYAIKAKKMNYSPTLVFQDNVENQNLYEQSLNFGLLQMSKIQQQILQKYQKQPFGPFKFIFKQGMGYDVVADKDLPQGMLVCEYVGDVVSYRKVIQQYNQNGHNDSLFELSVGKNADQTLYIRPEKYTNMARFINGVNNQTGKHKINVGSVKLMNKGRPGVFLYTTRRIKKGESLAYDYNAGGLGGYNTEDFL